MKLVDTHVQPDNSLYSIYEDGTVTLGKSTFKVKRHVSQTREGVQLNSTTYLEGKRGAIYLLRPFLGDDTGARQMVSTKTGAEYRVKGNRVKVIEIAGIIEEVL